MTNPCGRNRWSNKSSLEGLQENQTIHIKDSLDCGRCTVIHKLGYGLSSTIWLARDVTLNTYVAIKILTAEASKIRNELGCLGEFLMSQQSSEVRKLLEGLMNTRTLRAVCWHGPIALFASVGVGITSALYGTRKPLKKLLPFAHGFCQFMPRSCYINKGSPERDDEFWMISVRKPSREM